MSDDPTPEEQRDELHLQELRTARAKSDAQAEEAALRRLLEPYWGWARSIAYGRLGDIPNRGAAAEEIAQETLRRLVDALMAKLNFEKPFHVVASVNLKWAIGDFWRATSREQARPVDPHELPDPDARAVAPSPAEVSDALAPYLKGLTPRERELARERIVLDLSPAQIAARHDMSRSALDTAMHRLFKKMRENRPSDVRNQDKDAV